MPFFPFHIDTIRILRYYSINGLPCRHRKTNYSNIKLHINTKRLTHQGTLHLFYLNPDEYWRILSFALSCYAYWYYQENVYIAWNF